jgi:hypothetical protein
MHHAWKGLSKDLIELLERSISGPAIEELAHLCSAQQLHADDKRFPAYERLAGACHLAFHLLASVSSLTQVMSHVYTASCIHSIILRVCRGAQIGGSKVWFSSWSTSR